jgi:hypothetical protein
MIVTLDGERLTGPFTTGGTLQALIDQVRETQPAERLIVTVAVDGKPLVEEALSERLEGPADGIKQVDLGSADRRQLVREALCEVADRLAEVGDQQAGIADQLHSGGVKEAIDQFGQFLEARQLCQRSILECSGLLGQDLTTTDCEGQTVREHLDGLADKLRELRDAFEARDAVLLADLAQYEIPDTCRAWHGILKTLADSVTAQPTETSSGAPTP